MKQSFHTLYHVIEMLKHIYILIHTTNFGGVLLLLQFISLVIKLLVVINGGLLVLLVLRDKIVHVRLGFGELHLVHALASVPVQERLRERKVKRLKLKNRNNSPFS